MDSTDLTQSFFDTLFLYYGLILVMVLPVAGLFTGVTRWATGKPQTRRYGLLFFCTSFVAMVFLPFLIPFAVLACLLMPLIKWLKPKTPTQPETPIVHATPLIPPTRIGSLLLDLLGVLSVVAFGGMILFALADGHAFIFIFGHMVLYLWPLLAAGAIGGSVLIIRLIRRMIGTSAAHP